MKQRIAAVILSIALVVTCVPGVSFGETMDAGQSGTAEQVVQQVKDFSENILNYVQDKLLADLNKYLNEEAAKLKTEVEKVKEYLTVDNIQSAEDLKQEINSIIDKVQKYSEDFCQKAEVKEFVEKLEAAQEKLQSAISDFKEKAGSSDVSEIMEKIKNAAAEASGVLDKYVSKVKELIASDALKKVIEEAGKLREALPDLSKINIEDLAGQSKVLSEIFDYIKGIEPSEALNKLFVQAMEAYINTVKDITAASADIKVKTGTLEEKIEKGLNDAQAFITDVISYLNNYDKASYQDLIKKAEQAEAEIKAKEKDNQAQIDELIKKNENAAKDISSYLKKYAKNLENAAKVVQKKPTLVKKSTKNLKGKKIQVAWKGLKGAKASFYQVKVGSKTYKVKKATSSAKALKKVIKKLKKGKTYSVNVRAVFTFKERINPADSAGKTKTVKYYSQWSAVKKVKVKK